MPPEQPSPADEEILAAVRALQGGAGGDGFEVIYRRFYRSLFNFFANRPALREEADDLAHVTLIRAYESIHQYRFEASFAAWLWRIAENLWLNAVRERRALKRPVMVEVQPVVADPEGEVSTLSPLEAVSDESPDPEAAVLACERTRVLQEAIEALPPGMRRCIELRLFGDLKYPEIAAVTGIGLNSVRSQLFEARQRLKPVLDEYFQGAEL